MTNDTPATEPDRTRSPGAPTRPPAGRYGPEPTRARRRLAVAGVAALAAVGVGVTVWVGLGQADDPVRWKDIGFSLQGSEAVEVTFEVSMAPGTTAVCTIDALAPSYAQVGTVDVTVGPVDRTTSRYTVEVATSEPATTGVVHGCRVVEA